MNVKGMKIAYLVFLLLFFSSFKASAIILEFGQLDYTTEHLTIDYIEDGVTMSVDSGHYDIWGPSPDNTTQGVLNIDNNSAVVDSFPTSQVRFEMDGAAFDLLELTVYLAGNQLNEIKSSAGGVYEITDAGLITLSGALWENIVWFTFICDRTG